MRSNDAIISKLNMYKKSLKENNNSQMMMNKDKTSALKRRNKQNDKQTMEKDKQTMEKTYASMYKEWLEGKSKNCNKQIINQKTVKLYNNTQLVRK